MSTRCWKQIDMKHKMSIETRLSIQILPVQLFVLVKWCRCSHSLFLKQKLCPKSARAFQIIDAVIVASHHDNIAYCLSSLLTSCCCGLLLLWVFLWLKMCASYLHFRWSGEAKQLQDWVGELIFFYCQLIVWGNYWSNCSNAYRMTQLDYILEKSKQLVDQYSLCLPSFFHLLVDLIMWEIKYTHYEVN